MPIQNIRVETEVPSFPSCRAIQDPAARAFCSAVAELLEVREGERGDRLDQYITYRDLYHNGLLNLSIDQRPYIRFRNGPLTFLPLPPANDTSTDFTPPPPVRNLAAIGALANVIVSFDEPDYHNPAFVEIWRSGTDDLGVAALVGTAEHPRSLYADNLGQTGATRYYWVRNVSRAGVAGPFNAIPGTSATTGVVLTGDIADASITTAKIADGAVTTVKYADASITTVKIGDSQVSTVKIADASVTTVKINDSAVTTAKINDLSVTTGKFAELSVTTAKVANNAIDASKLNVQTHGIKGLTFTNNSPSAGHVAWTAHTISWDGNTYSIGAGSGNLEMVWLDRSSSTTTLRNTSRSTFETDYNNADGDILLAVNNGGIAETIYNATIVTAGGIKTGAIVADKIAAAAVVAGKIATNAIVAADGVIATAAIETAQIQNAAITNAKLGTAAVDSANIVDAAIVTAKIADANITTAKIGNAQITTALVANAAITTALIANAAITNALIANATIEGGKIANATITGSNIAADTITASNIAATTITGAKIAASTITSDKISVSTLSAIAADMGTVTAGTITLDSSGHVKSGQTAYHTGTGFFLGKDGATTKFSIGNPSGNYMTWDGTELKVVTNSLGFYAAGDHLLSSADTERTAGSSTYVKKKEIAVTQQGSLRIKFDLRVTAGGLPTNTSYGRIYINGSAVGTERTKTSAGDSGYETFSEDISGIEAGDLIQLYAKADNSVGSTQGYVRNFRIYNNAYIEGEVLLD